MFQLENSLENYLWVKNFLKSVKLQIAFGLNYNHIQCIVDCFEVEIEKPNDPVKQMLI